MGKQLSVHRLPLTVYRLRLTIYGLNDFNDFNDFNDSLCTLSLMPCLEIIRIRVACRQAFKRNK